MKLLILAGMLVIFISVIFIFFIINDMTNRHLDCIPDIGNKTTCNLKDVGIPFVISLMIIGMFVLIDCIVIYLLVKALVVKGSFGYTADI